MTKRNPLSFDNEQLTKGLKESVGQGVGAFFTPTQAATPSNDAKKQKETPHSPIERKSKKTGKSKQVNLQPDKLTSLQASKLTNLQTYIHSLLDEKFTEVGSFRMSENLLDKIDDLQHLLKKRYKIKLNKKDLVAIALAFAFWDLETNGNDSGIIRARKKRKED